MTKYAPEASSMNTVGLSKFLLRFSQFTCHFGMVVYSITFLNVSIQINVIEEFES